MAQSITVEIGGAELFENCDMTGLDENECGAAYAAAIEDELASEYYPEATIAVSVNRGAFEDYIKISDMDDEDTAKQDVKDVIAEIWNRATFWPK